MQKSQYQRYTKAYQQTPKGKYIRQRANAMARGIAWYFTFETWWEMWQQSGKWDQRGTGPDAYCMARKHDDGPYSPNNVRITTMSNNSKENLRHRWIS